MKMKFLALPALAILWAMPAHADWKTDLDTFQKGIETQYLGTLLLEHTGYTGAAIASCTTSILITGASFIADTTPIANGISEIIGNTVDDQYQTQTYDSIFSWEAASQMTRGAAGGGAVAIAETLEFVGLWLAGHESESYVGVRKMYASSIATADALFAGEGKCMMQLSKVLLLRKEINKRAMDKALANRAAKEAKEQAANNGVPTN